MLPFLKPRKLGAVMIAHSKPEGGIEDMHEEGENDPGLLSAMEDLHSAMNSKDMDAMAKAFQAAFDICDSKPESEMSEDNE